MAKLESEDKIQASCFEWLWNTHPRTRRLFFSIPLGGLRTPSEAARLQATGAVKGTPDTLLAIPGSINRVFYTALFIEFKTPDGKVTPEQAKCHEILQSAGNGVIIIRSLVDFQNLIRQYLKDTKYLMP
jgi:hypothetical protein